MGTHASAALHGLTVIDLTRVRAGPTCVRQFADWGANVIRVEVLEADLANSIQADFSARHDPDFQNLHRNKRSIALNLKTPGGLSVLRKLVERADVLVENFRPDVKGRLGIGYENLKHVNPRLVYTSISGFGQEGPYKNRPGVDQIAQGMSGLMSITGEPGRGPMRVGIALSDLSAGLFAALGTLVALHERHTSGEGQWVQTSLLEAQIFMLDFQGARDVMKGQVPQQVGNNHPTGSPTGVFDTLDGHVNIAPTPPMWRRFCSAIEREDFADHPSFRTNALRQKNREELNGMINDITKRYDSAQIIDRLNAAGIPCGPIYTLDQTFADPQVRHLGVTETVESPALGAINLLAQPVRLSRTPSAIARAAPEYAEHSNRVFEELGFTGEEIESLRREGAV